MTQTVTNISAYVSILSSLIMGRGVRGGEDGVIEAVAATTGQLAWFVTRSWNLSRSHSSFGSAPAIPLHLQPLPPNPLLSPSPK